ncbi:pre-peptidase C-terminal domain-containing protein [Acidovorax sp. ACV02]|uniref:pre-peptidase C-terminal domain-containing protein n=1 Tax=Acidovorax sp. ACV02 TaxID=2769310 RepID=UPI00177D705E|nr:pre-peptidase C-terminal domain-containing protein [Acidovorax sp. ACV02]
MPGKDNQHENEKIMRLSISAWRSSIAVLSVTALAMFCGQAYAQQVMQLVPGQAPSDRTALAALSVKPGESLRIENLRVNDASPTVVNLELRRSEVVSAGTQYTVVDEKGRRAYPLAVNAHFVGVVQGKPDSYAFATVSPDGEIRTIIHQDKDTLLNELVPARSSGDGKAVSRAVDHQRDFVNREFSCGVTPAFLQSDPTQRKLLFQQVSNTGESGSSQAISEKAGTQRRADIIIDSDYEFYQLKGTEAAAFNYAVDLFTYVGTRYQSEVSTRFNLKQIIIRTSTVGPWTATDTSSMLTQLRDYGNGGAYSPQTWHHVHLLSGKPAGGGIAYVNTLGVPTYAYGVSASLAGNFTPSNPQVIWDSVVVAHEIGHAFGSSHTHDYDNPAVVPSPNTGGAIDCCYSGNATGQCGVALGGAGRYGYLPGLSSTTGGGAGQSNGTIMSYCHLLSGGMSNIAWSFGTGHPYGVNAGRVPIVMTGQAQTYLPLDASSTYDVYVTKAGAGASTGTVTSAPAGINCGTDCTEAFAVGTSVTLSATAGAGYVFAGWSGAGCSGTGTCTVTVDSYKSITATFNTPPVGVLSIAKIGTGAGTVTRSGGALNCGSTCTESFTPGATVTLTATPAAGSTFAGWSGGTCTGTGSCSFTINANTTVNAQFNLSSGGTTSTPLLQSNLSGSAGSNQYFSVVVPTGATNLVIQMNGGSGDVDLYVKFNQVPTLSSYDCRPYLDGNSEICTFATPSAGTYHIMLSGYQQFSGVTLAASYQTNNPTNPSDISTIINLLLLD